MRLNRIASSLENDDTEPGAEGSVNRREQEMMLVVE